MAKGKKSSSKMRWPTTGNASKVRQVLEDQEARITALEKTVAKMQKTGGKKKK